MNLNRRFCWSAALGVLLAGACSIASAQQDGQQNGADPNAPAAMPKTQGGADQSPNGHLARKDVKFMREAAQGGMAEVELGKLAQSKASSEEVKQFATQMAQDHGKANDELKQIAEAKGISVPASSDRKHKREMKKLEKQSGADFDRRYMAAMVKDHEKDLKEFNDAAKNASDPDVKAFAEKTAQVISSHLEMARKIAGDVGVKGEKSGKLESGTGKLSSNASGSSSTGK
jgi:putative membrane protein